MQKQIIIPSLLLLFCLFFTCQSEEIKIAKSLDGTWTINSITHYNHDSAITTLDTIFREPIGEINFEFCNFNKGENCSGTITFADGEFYGISYRVDEYLDQGLFSINVMNNSDYPSNATIPNIQRPLSFTDTEWTIHERSDDELAFTYGNSFNKSARVKCTKK